MSEKETEQAYDENGHYRKPVINGYPYLISFGKELSDQGIRFHDLTMIFTGNIETLYNDKCCHFNNRGYELIGEAIGKAFLLNTE